MGKDQLGAEYLLPSDFAEAGEAYLRYCGGLAILQYPEELAGLHGQPEPEKAADEVVASARRIMFSGARRFVRSAVPPQYRGKIRSIHRDATYDMAEPGMRELLGYVCVLQSDRLTELNTMYPVLRPAPFLRRDVYTPLTRGDFSRISTTKMMDDFEPHPILMDQVYKS